MSSRTEGLIAASLGYGLFLAPLITIVPAIVFINWIPGAMEYKWGIITGGVFLWAVVTFVLVRKDPKGIREIQ